MKFVRFDGGRTGLVVGDDCNQVVDVVASLEALAALDASAARAIESVLPRAGTQHWESMIGAWDEVGDAFRTLERQASGSNHASLTVSLLAQVKLEAPLASPQIHIFSLGSNTAVHIQRAFKVMQNLDLSIDDALSAVRSGAPPMGFTILPATVVGPGARIVPPTGTQKLDYEGECAVYLKHGGRNLMQVSLWGHVAWNDLGVRDTHLKLSKEAPWGPFSMNLPKNFNTGNACGPWVVVDEGHDVGRLRCRVKVNGEVRQDWNLSEMIYGFENTLAYLSDHIELRPGDMLTSGTGAGVAIESGVDGPHWLKPKDVVEVTLEGAGTLINVVGEWDRETRVLRRF